MDGDIAALKETERERGGERGRGKETGGCRKDTEVGIGKVKERRRGGER